MPRRANRIVRAVPPSLESLEVRRLLTTFTVTNVNDSGTGSLRQAIINANGATGTDTINFSIGSGTRTITPNRTGSTTTNLGPLPDITDPVTIDGTAPATFGTQVIELNGQFAPSGSNGLKVIAGSSTIRTLTINRFPNNGIELATGGSNVVEGCKIGTSTDGSSDLGNGDDGIDVNGSSNNRIGGTTAAQRNVISGNTSDGIDIGSGSSGNQVQGNFIGIRSSGTVALGNALNGIRVSGANNTIGGTTSAYRNVISGNAADGIRIGGAAATGNQVQGNYIGLNSAGTAALANGTGVDGGVGVLILTASSNTIGGATSGHRNVISGNVGDGVEINGGGGTATGNVVAGNYIGTTPAGTAALANGNDGVGVRDAAGNTVGGTAAGTGNLLSGNADDGVEIHGATATGNAVQGNFIGTDSSGFNPLGNQSDGVELEGTPNNTIGGSAAGAGNVIASNASDGIEIWSGDLGASGPSDGNVVEGNFIGTNASGTAGLGNSKYGVYVAGGNNNRIGGVSVAAAGNAVTANGSGGVTIEIGAGNAVRGNRIFANTVGATEGAGLGIDLGATTGVTANDNLDADGGANGLQNFPVLSAANASADGSSITLQGTLNSEASRTFALDFYASPAADPSGFGEGQTYLGSASVTTDAAGNAAFSTTLGVSVAIGQVVSATATAVSGAAGSTSEFSAVRSVTGAAPPVVSSFVVDDGTAQRAVVRGVTVTFDRPVTPATGAFVLTGLDGAAPGTTTSWTAVAGSGNAAWTVTFAGPQVAANGMLPKGNYELRVAATQVTSAGGGPAMTQDRVHPFHAMPGDGNGDRSTNIADFAILQNRYNQPGTPSQGDYNGDGQVNIADFAILQNNYNQTLAPPTGGGSNLTVVPNPTPVIITTPVPTPTPIPTPAPVPANAVPTVLLMSTGMSVMKSVATVRLEAAASDPDGEVRRVEFYRGDTMIGEDATAPYVLVVPGMAAGSHVFSARAIDDKGDVGTSAPLTVTVSPAVPRTPVARARPITRTALAQPAAEPLQPPTRVADNVLGNGTAADEQTRKFTRG